MRGLLTTSALMLATTLVVASTAFAEGPTREEYVAQTDPICQKNTEQNSKLLDSARKLQKENQLPAAGSKVAIVAGNFKKSVTNIEAVPRPPEDSPRLEKWFGRLEILRSKLLEVSKWLKKEDKIKASHAKIAVEKSSNAANNVSFVFGFQYCHLTAAQFR